MTQGKKLLAILLVAVFGLGLAACGSDSDSDGTSPPETTTEAETTTGSEAAPDGVEGVTWTLMNIGSNEGWATSIPNTIDPPTLEIENGQAAVFTGCNSGRGSAEVSDKTITFGPVGITQMACEQAQSQIEFLVTKVLEGKVTYEINSDGNLVLERKGNTLVYTPE